MPRDGIRLFRLVSDDLLFLCLLLQLSHLPTNNLLLGV